MAGHIRVEGGRMARHAAGLPTQENLLTALCRDRKLPINAIGTGDGVEGLQVCVDSCGDVLRLLSEQDMVDAGRLLPATLTP